MHPLTRIVFVVALMAPLATPLQAQTPAAPAVVEIDGAKNPELVPQWVLWRATFRLIASSGTGSSVFTDDLYAGVSSSERTTIGTTARTVMERHEQCLAAEEQRLNRMPDIRTAPVAELKERLARARIGCRQLLLDARDGLASRLTDGGWLALQAFSRDRLPGLRISVPKGDLDEFRRPQ